MSETRNTSPSAPDRTDLIGPETDGGMRVPDGIDMLAQAVPSSIPPEMFDDAPPSAPAPIVLLGAPRMAPMKPPSLPKMAAVAKPPSLPRVPVAKPASLPRVAVAKKPASLPRMAAVKGLSPPKQAIAIRTELPDPHGAVTAQMPVMELPPESVPTVPPAATDAADHPSSFPSSGKMLVFEALPASVDGIVVTPAHVRLAGDENGEQEEQEEREEAEERDSLEATSPRAFEIVEIPGLQKRRWLQVMAVLAVGAFASMFLAGRLSRPKAEPAAPNGPTTSLAMAVTVPEPTEEATPPAPPAPPSAAVAVAEPVAAPAAPSGKGILNTAASTPGRRIFVDDRAVGETPAAVAVPCGVHRVRVGSRGKTMTVDVVCEGEVSVSDR